MSIREINELNYIYNNNKKTFSLAEIRDSSRTWSANNNAGVLLLTCVQPMEITSVFCDDLIINPVIGFIFLIA